MSRRGERRVVNMKTKILACALFDVVLLKVLFVGCRSLFVTLFYQGEYDSLSIATIWADILICLLFWRELSTIADKKYGGKLLWMHLYGKEIFFEQHALQHPCRSDRREPYLLFVLYFPKSPGFSLFFGLILFLLFFLTLTVFEQKGIWVVGFWLSGAELLLAWIGLIGMFNVLVYAEYFARVPLQSLHFPVSVRKE